MRLGSRETLRVGNREEPNAKNSLEANSAAPVAQLDSASPSEGEGCPFEPGREHHFTADDVSGMETALLLAERAAAAGDVPIGALLSVDGWMFEAFNEKEARPDPTAHAEMLVIAQAARVLNRWRLGGTLYVTKEPCPMCAGAIAAARIERLVYGCSDPKGGATGGVVDLLSSAVVNHKVDVTRGVLEAETSAQLRAFFSARRK
jgi:tRNA(adenine34) deaminase